ncbi:hypothetical protein ABZ642_22325 [Streptomyces sp. NPDC007157]|uniref:hypothetical protein n=1 Tax=Streptomyces sp. NPDC007157 TaxID=3154681 RepID=UPI0033ED3012
MRSAVVAGVALLLVTGCSARPSTGAAEPDLCPTVASTVSAPPPSEPVRYVELGAVRCSDADSGISAVDITVKNTGTDEANYYVTVEFVDSEHRSLGTEDTYFGHVSAAATETRTALAARPADGRGLSVRIVAAKREAVVTKAPATALDKAVGLFVSQGLVPADTPYGDCRDAAPQAYWIGDRGNCWTVASALPPLPVTPAPSAVAPALPGAVCADGRISGSSGRGTCSHHGGVSR